MRGKPSLHRQKMRPNSIRKIMVEATQYDDVISLQIGEPECDTAAHIIAAGQLAMEQGYTHYTSNAGLPELREAIAGRMKRKYDIDVSPARIVVTSGAVSALHTILLALVDSGEEVLIPDPGYPNYEGMLIMQQAEPVYYKTDAAQHYIPDMQDIEAKITPATKAIIVNSPCNPTGAVYAWQVWEELLKLAERHDLFIISDEIYDELVYEGEVCSPLQVRPDLAHRIVSVNGFSKGYAMTGWRLGYMIVPEELIELTWKLLEPTTTCAAEFTQKAGIAALTGDQTHIEEERLRYKLKRDRACALLTRYGIPHSRPQGAFYIMADISATGRTSEPFALELLHRHRVIVAPGEGFGPAGLYSVRICFAGKLEQLEEGIHRLGRYYGELTGRTSEVLGESSLL